MYHLVTLLPNSLSQAKRSNDDGDDEDDDDMVTLIIW
jgi:hypothetical protein